MSTEQPTKISVEVSRCEQLLTEMVRIRERRRRADDRPPVGQRSACASSA